ncbi:MAG: hypothetical protein CL681_17435 [Blastopirellula sp.]|nr:hypothetical protein [Blastopirellula sp.]
MRAAIEHQPLLQLYQTMLTARLVDEAEVELTKRGAAHFHVSGSGHEATAALAEFLSPDDWLHCHYRDKALMLARGLTPKHFFDSLLCNDDSSSHGRRMNAFFSDRELHLLSMVCPVGNSALQSVGVAAAVKDRATHPVVVCSVGDGTTQQGEFMEGCAEAWREQLPVLFLIQDNGLAISTSTQGKLLYQQVAASSFCGVPIQRVSGCDAVATREAFQAVIAEMRASRQPTCIVLDVERLASHTNADDQTVYRSSEAIEAARTSGDPILNLQQTLLDGGVSEASLSAIQDHVAIQVAEAQNAALNGGKPSVSVTVKQPIPIELTHPSREKRGAEASGELTMREALRDVLADHLQRDPRVTLFGQDIEDPKGDVFGVTRTLSTQFGERVKNAPLTESTIVGVSIGRALAGERPVAFLQFADFLPLAYNQIVSELGTMYWRTAGAWSSPVILMIACGGYRPGLGPFHAQTFDSAMAQVPGIDVLMPSTAADAAGMLNAAFLTARPTIFLYPKACLNDPQHRTSSDVAGQFVPVGVSRKVRSGDEITLVGWGNTVNVCEQVAATLAESGAEADVIDLRSLSPWDQRAVISSAEKTARLLVVHEDNQTSGFGAEVLATVAEQARVPVSMERVARPDTHIPCNFANQLEVLPSYERVLTAAARLLDFEIDWQEPEPEEEGVYFVEAVGSGPADEAVVVCELFVQPGQTVQPGDVVASLEATKSVFELTSAASGIVEQVLVNEGDTIAVGKPLVRLQLDAEVETTDACEVTQAIAKLRRVADKKNLAVRTKRTEHRAFDVGISSIAIAQGSRIVPNEELAAFQPDRGSTDISRRTGIESRRWIGQGEDAVSLAAKACWEVLDQEQLIVDDIDLVVCATTSPQVMTPSMACHVLSQLSGGNAETSIQAYDINAACSGYLYSLQAGYDYLQSDPEGRVLVVTAEVLSPLLDLKDFDTSILFGDATSATVLYGEAHCDRSRAWVHRPKLSARGDVGQTLSVPFLNDGYIKMKGQKVFSEAVRSMISSLTRTCRDRGIAVDDLEMIVPHQANQRIIDAIQSRVAPRVFSNIRHHGNTSSTSIPLCLRDVLPNSRRGQKLGLCAFGGGFTFGAGILEIN